MVWGIISELILFFANRQLAPKSPKQQNVIFGNPINNNITNNDFISFHFNRNSSQHRSQVNDVGGHVPESRDMDLLFDDPRATAGTRNAARHGVVFRTTP